MKQKPIIGKPFRFIWDEERKFCICLWYISGETDKTIDIVYVSHNWKEWITINKYFNNLRYDGLSIKEMNTIDKLKKWIIE